MLRRALLASTLAVAAPIPHDQFYDGMPPARLQQAAPGVIRVVFGHLADCGRPNDPEHPEAVFAACIRNDGIMELPNPCEFGDREQFARLACHEQAHFLGWPKDHGA